VSRRPAKRRIGVAAIVLFLCLGESGAAEVRAEDCGALLAADTVSREACSCLFDRALAGGPGEKDAKRQLTQVAEESPDKPWPSFYLGRLVWDDAERSADLFARAAKEFSSSGDFSGEVYARDNRSKQLFRLGLLDEAAAEAEAAARAGTESGRPDLEAHGRLVLARQIAESGGDLRRVVALLSASAGEQDEPNAAPCAEGTSATRMECLLTLGQVWVEQGQPVVAERVFRRLVAMAREQRSLRAEAGAWYGLTRVAAEELSEVPDPRQVDEVVERARNALALAEQSNRPAIAAKSHWVLGVLLPGPEGVAHLDACTALSTTDRDRSYCLNALARHLARTDPERAANTVEKSLALAQEAQDSWSQAFAWREAMRVRWAEGDVDRAVEDSWGALDAIERLRDVQVEGSEIQAGLFSTWADDYSWFAGQLLRTSGREIDVGVAEAQAFRVEERARARALTDWLRRTAPAGEAAKAGEDVEIGERFAKLDRVRAALAPDEALLSFQVAPWKDLAGDFGGGSWLMAVTQQGVTVHRLPGRSDIRRAVRLFEGLVGRRDGSEAGPGAHFYQTLLAPALSVLPPEVTRLVLVPDDALHRLPFAALRPTVDGVPLGERFELVRVPSATLWLHWRSEEPPRPEQPVLVLADPMLSGGRLRSPNRPDRDDEQTDAPGADGSVTQLAQARGGDRDAEAQPAQTYGPLTYAREEGRMAIRDLGGGLLLAGPKATEARLASLDLSRFGLLHFAAHAVTDEDRPERSAVLLAADGTGGDGAHDGRLESAEIARLHLGGRTVVLASCRSADGTVLRGEGVMSLARAFFQAGAHGVVASLWPLRDDESAAQFERFYRHLAGGETVAGALHAARREAIAAGEPAAAWAGLVVLGDGALVPVPGGRRVGLSPGLVASALIALLAVLGGAVAMARRRRRPRRTR